MASVYRRGNMWWIKYTLAGRLIRESLRTNDRKVANYLCRKREAELAEGRSPLPPKRMDPNACIDEFLQDTAIRKKPSTYKQDQHRTQEFVKWTNLSSMRQITESMINDYMKHLVQERGLSPFTANSALGIVQKWLTWCQRHSPPYVVDNPALRVKGFAKELNPPRFLNPEEIERLLSAATGSHLYSMIATAIFAGLRVSELRYLEWTDIDREHDTITVQNKHDWQYKTKSRKFRVIPLNERLKKILLPLAKSTGFCFPTPKGDRYYEQPKRAFYQILKKVELKGVGWHTLRKTFGSELARQGVSLLKIQKWMGHSDPRITMQHYAHLSPTFDEDINKIGKLKPA